MISDSITDEIRRIRHELAARFNNDVASILADARQREAADRRVYVTLPKRPAGGEPSTSASVTIPLAGPAAREAPSAPND